MITTSGIIVDPGMDSAPGAMDIAVGMCRITRYAGAIWCPLSVHSILTAEMAFQNAGEHRLWAYGLLHDAHEIVTGEIVRAWKPTDLKAGQTELDTRIFPKFGLHKTEMNEIKHLVKAADDKAHCLEATLLGLPGWKDYYTRIHNRPPASGSPWEVCFANSLFSSDWMKPDAILKDSKEVAALNEAFLLVQENNFPAARRKLSGPLIARIMDESPARGAV